MARRAGDWDPRVLPDLTGRTYLVTGSTRGLGYFASEQLARAGASVIMTGRNPNRLASAHAAIDRRLAGADDWALASPSGGKVRATVETLLLDTSNLGSVRAAAATIRSRKRLDGVLLNAGIVHPPKERETTGDGNEIVFATNVLGHFALAGELLVPLAARHGRLVWVGSMSTSMWAYDPVDPQLTTGYTGWRAYVQSKVATTALAIEADRRLRDARVPVASVGAHPGYSTSGRTVGVSGVNEPSRFKRFADNLQAAVTQSKEHGAWSLVRALVDPGAESGDFYGPKYVAHGEPRLAEPARVTREDGVGDRLWQICEETTRMRWPMEKAAKARRR